MNKILITFFMLLSLSVSSYAALNIDRTRIIYHGENNGTSVTIVNKDDSSAFLAQTWIETVDGKKLEHSLVALPFLQKINSGQKKQIKISHLDGQNMLPNDKETLLYFNLLGIPPQSKEKNVVQFTIQSKLKLFYRPKGLSYTKKVGNDFQQDLVIEKTGQQVTLINPTPYNIIVVNINNSVEKDNNFNETIVPPLSRSTVNVNSSVKNNVMLGYIDDYGSLKFSQYHCQLTQTCQLETNTH